MLTPRLMEFESARCVAIDLYLYHIIYFVCFPVYTRDNLAMQRKIRHSSGGYIRKVWEVRQLGSSVAQRSQAGKRTGEA
jgi:hypothetical protein